MTKSKMFMSLAVAGMIGAGAVVASAVYAEDQVKCMGVNECKGKTSCHTSTNACKGKNECKGKGVVMLPKAECAAKGGKELQESTPNM